MLPIHIRRKGWPKHVPMDSGMLLCTALGARPHEVVGKNIRARVCICLMFAPAHPIFFGLLTFWPRLAPETYRDQTPKSESVQRRKCGHYKLSNLMVAQASPESGVSIANASNLMSGGDVSRLTIQDLNLTKLTKSAFLDFPSFPT